MMYGYLCPECGAALDPGEKCDCREKAAQAAATAKGGKRKETKKRIPKAGNQIKRAI